MGQFQYSYDTLHQCLVKSSSTGQELQRMFVPIGDIEKLLATLWGSSYDRVFAEDE